MEKFLVHIFVLHKFMTKRSFLLLVFLGMINFLKAQDNRLVQVSGIIYCLENDKVRILPFGEVSIHNTFRVMYGSETGFFSIAAQRGDTLSFNYLSYDEEIFVVPKDYPEESITLNVRLNQDTVYLPKAYIQAWPSKEHFRPEFLAMDVEESMYQIAMSNLAKDRIQELMLLTPRDGAENASLYLGQQARKFYYTGQFQPINIMSPTAWLEFFQAWKRGDFKKKKKK